MNNYAVSSDGIATALQDSASSLMAANNSYQEAVSLIAAANKVVQDPNSVGAALRTISLRLRGTSTKELEEAGEDTEGTITSKSKLRSKIKTLSGVDILTDTGAYKSTYQILLEISKVWEKMSDIDQAALLEIIAGKTRSNTAAAILSNTTDLENAYVDALHAEGSAYKENEKHMNSIQGKIDLFNNAVQTLWSNTLDDAWIKGFVDFGTTIVKVITNVGMLQSALLALLAIKFIPWILKLITSTYTFGAALRSILAPIVTISGTKTTLAQFFAQTAAGAMNAAGGVSTFSAYLGAAGKTLKAFIHTPLVWFMAAAVAIGIMVGVTNELWPSAEKAAKAAKELVTEYQNAQNTLRSHSQTISDIKDDYEELAKGVDNLGNNVSLTTEEYKHYNEITNQIADMFPQMVAGYTDEGNAIIKLKGNVDALTEAYEKEAEAARQAILKDSNDIFKSSKITSGQSFFGSDGFWKSVGKSIGESFSFGIWQAQASNEQILQLRDYVNGQTDIFNEVNEENISRILKTLEQAGADVSWLEIAGSSRGALDRIIKENRNIVEIVINDVESQIAEAASNNRTVIDAYLNNTDEFEGLSTSTKNLINQIVQNLDDEFVTSFSNNKDAYKWIDNTLLNGIGNMNASTKAEISLALDLQTKYNNGEIEIGEYEDKVQEIIKMIDALNLDNEDEIIKAIRLVFDVDENGETNAAVKNIVRNLLQSSDKDKVETLTNEDLNIVDKNISSWNIPDNIPISWDELLKKIEEAKQITEDTSITDSLSKINSLEDAFNSLGDAIKEFKEDDTVSAKTLESLKELFGDIEGFEELYTILATGEGNVEEAITNVANAYIAQKGILSDLTEDEQKLMIARLKALGVVNAQEALQAEIANQRAQEELDMKYQQYSIDLSNYANAETAKFAIASQMTEQLSWIADDQVEKLGKSYDVDLSNYATLQEKKIQLAIQAGKKIAEQNKTDALNQLNQAYVGTERYRDSYKQKKAAIEAQYQAALSSISDVGIYDQIQSIVDSYNYAPFKFDFSGNRIGIGRDAEEQISTKASDILSKIQKKYENKIALLEAQQTYIENEIKRAEAEDRQVGKAVYEEQINLEQQKIKLYEQELAALQKQMSSVAKGSDEWYEFADAIWNVKHNIQESTIAVIDFKQKIIDLYVDAFGKIEEAFGNQQKLYEYQQDYIRNNIEYLELLNEPISADSYKNLIEIQKQAYESAKNEAASLSDTLAMGMKNGSIKEGSKEWTDLTFRIWESATAAQQARNEIEKTNDELKQLYVDNFDKIITAFDNLDDLHSDRQSYIEDYINYMELIGEPIPTSAYDYMIEEENQKLTDNLQELSSLREQLADSINNGEIEVGSDEWIDMESKIRDCEKAIQDNRIALANYNKDLQDLYVQAFDKVKSAFGNENDLYNDQQSFIDSYIDYLETLNVKVPAELYEKQIAIEEQKQQRNIKQLEKLQEELAKMESQGITPEDDAWVQAHADIRDCEAAIWDSEKALAEFNKTMHELDSQVFDEIIKRIDDITDELSNVYDLISDEDVATEDGAWTEEGITSLGLMIQKMEVAKAKSKEYQKEIENLNNEYKSGAISEQEYNDRLVELKNSQWDAINAYEDAKDAIIDINEARIDMVEDGINKEIDAYQELIDLKKKELDAERDLYDFRKNIKDQTKDIASLERKIAAMSGSTDAATVAERTKLQAQLREAREGLDDTYYNHAMDSQQQALDDESEAFAKAGEDYVKDLRENLKNVEQIVSDTLAQVFINADTVLGELNTISDEHGITLSDALTQPWNNAAIRAEEFKNSAIGMQNEFLIQNGLFTGEINTQLDNMFGAGSISAGLFQTAVANVVDAIKTKVTEDEPTIQGQLVLPYSEALKYVKDTFSVDVQNKLQEVANKAESLVKDETTDITEPFKKGAESANTFSQTAQEALENVAKKATSIRPALIDDLTTPPNNGSNAYDLFGTEVANVFNDMITNAQNAAEEISTSMNDIVEDAKKATNAINNVGSDGSGSGGGGGNQSIGGGGATNGGGAGRDTVKIKALQTFLNNYWSANLAVDGSYGPATKAAVKNVQKKVGASVDGYYGTTTQSKLKYYYEKLINQLKENNNGSSMIGQGVQRYKNALNAIPAAMYAKGTLGTKKDQWAITDEPQYGDELVLIPNKEGNLSYMRKGTSIVPADITENLMKWGQFTPNMEMSNAVQGVNLMSNFISKPILNLSFDALVKAEKITEDTLPALKKFVTEELDKFSKNLNYSLKRAGAR